MSSDVTTEANPLDKQLNTLVDERTYEQVRKLAFLQRASKAAIVRRAISSYIAMHKDSLREIA